MLGSQAVEPDLGCTEQDQHLACIEIQGMDWAHKLCSHDSASVRAEASKDSGDLQLRLRPTEEMEASAKKVSLECSSGRPMMNARAVMAQVAFRGTPSLLSTAAHTCSMACGGEALPSRM